MKYTIILGSNMGDRLSLLKGALTLMSNKGCVILERSHIYETEPWGFESENNFYNQVAILESRLEAEDFLSLCLITEKELGRIRNKEVCHKQKKVYASRPIDIDVLFCEELLHNSKSLILPHPRIEDRKFVLTPLVELLPEFIHPKLNLSLSHILSKCKDTSEIKKVL